MPGPNSSFGESGIWSFQWQRSVWFVFFNRSPKVLLYTIQMMRVGSWEFTFITVLEWVCLFLVNVLMCLKISSQSRLRSDLQWTWDVSQMLMIFEDSNCILFMQRIFILNSAENLVCSWCRMLAGQTSFNINFRYRLRKHSEAVVHFIRESFLNKPVTWVTLSCQSKQKKMFSDI